MCLGNNTKLYYLTSIFTSIAPSTVHSYVIEYAQISLVCAPHNSPSGLESICSYVSKCQLLPFRLNARKIIILPCRKHNYNLVKARLTTSYK